MISKVRKNISRSDSDSLQSKVRTPNIRVPLLITRIPRLFEYSLQNITVEAERNLLYLGYDFNEN